MQIAKTLIEDVKKQREENLLRKYGVYTETLIIPDILDHGIYRGYMTSEHKSFTSNFGFIKYLRRIGFKVTLKSMFKRSNCVFGNFYELHYTVELDKEQQNIEIYI